MPRPKRTLTEVDPNEMGTAAKKGKPMEATAAEATSAPENPQEPEFITMCRPGWDKEAEIPDWESVDGDDDEDAGDEGFEDIGEVEGSDDDDEDGAGHGKDCMCKKPAKDYPDWTWIITEAGFKLLIEWQVQAMKRDQDNFGMYIYNDYTAYGLAEVMENQFLAFDKEMSKDCVSPFALWSLLESIGMFLNGDIDRWFGGDDSDTMAETIMLFGTAVLTTLTTLRTHNLLGHPRTSPIKNTPLVLALFVLFVEAWKSIGGDHGIGETFWTRNVVTIADEAGITIAGPAGVEEKVAKLREEIEDEEFVSDGSDDEIVRGVEEVKAKAKAVGEEGKKWKSKDDYFEGEVRLWRKWDWKIEFAEYFKHHGKRSGTRGKLHLGGDHYDITKMPKSQKKQYELGRGVGHMFD